MIEIDERREGTLRCPVCGVVMHIERKEKIAVDVCTDHGIWLHKGEIERITQAVRDKTLAFGSALGRSSTRKAKEHGKVLGTAFGWWSLLFP